MLRPTIYLPSRAPCLTKIRWDLAQASLEAIVAHVKREAERDDHQPRSASPAEDPLAAVAE